MDRVPHFPLGFLFCSHSLKILFVKHLSDYIKKEMAESKDKFVILKVFPYVFFLNFIYFLMFLNFLSLPIENH